MPSFQNVFVFSSENDFSTSKSGKFHKTFPLFDFIALSQTDRSVLSLYFVDTGCAIPAGTCSDQKKKSDAVDNICYGRTIIMFLM